MQILVSHDGSPFRLKPKRGVPQIRVRLVQCETQKTVNTVIISRLSTREMRENLETTKQTTVAFAV